MTVYCVISYVCLKDLFSTINRDEESTVLVSDNADLYAFLKNNIASEKIQVLKVETLSPSIWGLVNKSIVNRWLSETFKIVNTPIKKLYYFCNAFSLNFFFLINSLRKKGVEIIFWNSDSHLDINPIKMSFRDVLKNKILMRLLYGFKIDIYRFRRSNVPVYNYDNNKLDILLRKDWNTISREFNLRLDRQQQEGDILFIDCPIQSIEGVCLKASQKKIADFLSQKIESGETIYYKGHPGVKQSSLEGTSQENIVEIVPPEIPSEIVLLGFNKAYAFATSSLNTFEGEIQLLGDLLVFESEELEKKYTDLLGVVRQRL